MVLFDAALRCHTYHHEDDTIIQYSILVCCRRSRRVMYGTALLNSPRALFAVLAIPSVSAIMYHHTALSCTVIIEYLELSVLS